MTMSYNAVEKFGRIRLSPSFFMRDFLYSEVSNWYQVPNLPDDPKLAEEVGRRLCVDLLEPLNATFGRIAVDDHSILTRQQSGSWRFRLALSF